MHKTSRLKVLVHCRLKFLLSEYYFGANYISGVKADYLCLLKARKLYVTVIYSRTKGSVTLQQFCKLNISYRMSTGNYGVHVIEVPLRRTFTLDPGHYSFGSCTFREHCETLFLKTREIYVKEEKYLP